MPNSKPMRNAKRTGDQKHLKYGKFKKIHGELSRPETGKIGEISDSAGLTEVGRFLLGQFGDALFFIFRRPGFLSLL